MALKYIKCSPSGNITVLVTSKFERKNYASIAIEIMSLFSDVEQVGFIEEPKNKLAVIRLQMMGGEFCGNAARSLAWVALKKGWINASSFFIESSGANSLLRAEIQGDRVRIEHPIRNEIDSISIIDDFIIVDLVGITHVLVEGPPKANAKGEVFDCLKRLDLLRKKAAGVMYTVRTGKGLTISPYVWVRETKSLVEESACASGTQAVVTAEAWKKRESLTLEVNQPSGDKLTGIVEFCREKNCFLKAYTEGKVVILEEGKYEHKVR